MFSGALCSSHRPSQRDASRSQQSTCGPAQCLFLISDKSIWTHYWQMAAQQGLQIVVSFTTLKSCVIPPVSSSRGPYILLCGGPCFCVRTTFQLPQASWGSPTGLDFCRWGGQQLPCWQEFGGNSRGTASHGSTTPSTSCSGRDSGSLYGHYRANR